MYLGEKQHDDPEFVSESHHQMLSSLLGRLKPSYLINYSTPLCIMLLLTMAFILCYSKVDAHESMVYSYRHGFSGFAAKLTESQAKKLAGTHSSLLS